MYGAPMEGAFQKPTDCGGQLVKVSKVS